MRELGEYLKAERLNRKLTLEELSTNTRISVRMLEAIEDGSLEKIGTPILIRGFIKSYCHELGIDPEPTLVEYERKICDFDTSPASIQKFEGWVKPGRKKSPMGMYFLFLLVLAVIGGVFASDWISKRKEFLSSAPESMRTDTYPQQELLSDFPQTDSSSQQKEEPSVEKQEEVVAEPIQPPAPVVTAENKATTLPVPERHDGASASSKPVEESGGVVPEGTISPAREMQNQAIAKELINEEGTLVLPDPRKQLLQVEAAQETWIQVTVDDGKRVQGVLLKSGETRQWEADKKMEIVIGNAGGIQLQWNGKPLNILGKPGQVVRLNLPDPKYLD